MIFSSEISIQTTLSILFFNISYLFRLSLEKKFRKIAKADWADSP